MVVVVLVVLVVLVVVVVLGEVTSDDDGDVCGYACMHLRFCSIMIALKSRLLSQISLKSCRIQY